ncbi:MAG: DUF2911 domain-containing protein, partial [Gemmatimonadetes bacterium]|nr:DUF2911 domain-containing protein [Gemmatimonadota bacterium]NIQ58381.1 DUF2911 domain-containing protein [Gemmatimonadota bacterium]NIU78597.1 DUF2911 domain-containing protein [Gammaproteobacteria bacterium]NIX47437.1 DUF2911 domain-containing protein [Gemmatimonadota bacterium]
TSLNRLVFTLTVAALLAPAAGVAQAEEEPGRRLSPVGITKAHIGDAYVKVTYGRPFIRDRAIFGADTTYLVPFDRLWRTGANEATEITLTEPLQVGGTLVEAGTYAMFTVPGASSWEVRLSPQLGLDGTGWLDPATGEFTPDVYDSERDVATFTVEPTQMDEVVDPFTMEFEPKDGGADLVLRWERTEVRIPIERPGE